MRDRIFLVVLCSYNSSVSVSIVISVTWRQSLKATHNHRAVRRFQRPERPDQITADSFATALSISSRDTSKCVTIRICVSEIPIASTPFSFNLGQISLDFLPVPETSKITMFVATV